MSRRKYHPRKRTSPSPQLILWVLGVLVVLSFLQSLSPIELTLLTLVVASGIAGYIFYKSKQRHERQSSLLALSSDYVDAMDGVPFEEYVQTVFQRLGYRVETTRASGDFGVDLIIFRDGIRIAVQCKRHLSSIGVKAIQEAHAGMTHYKCDKSMVVTNNTFTRAAKELAHSTNCQLVDRLELGRLVKLAGQYS